MPNLPTFEVDFRTGNINSVRNNYTATVYGNAPLVQTSKGYAVTTGSGKYLGYSGFTMPSNAISVVAFAKIKPTHVIGTGRASIYGLGISGSGVNFLLSYSSLPYTYMRLGSTNARYFSYTPDRLWHCFIFTLPGNLQTSIINSSFYVDSVVQGINSTASSGSQDLRTGTSYIGTSYSDSAVDISLVRVYDYVISQKQIEAAQVDFESSRPLAKNKVSMYYPEQGMKTTPNPLGAGLIWNQSTDVYERTGSAYGKNGGTDFNSIFPWSHIKRCVLDDNGNVVYYLDPNDSTKKADGTASKLDGTDGQVMVEIPKFYYNHIMVGNEHHWMVSGNPLCGEVHPMFYKNDVIVEKRYVGAYEGVLYDVSSARYANCVQITAHSATFSASNKTITANALTGPYTNLQVNDKIVVTGTTNNNATFTVVSSTATVITVSEALVDETAASTVIETEKNVAASGDKLSSISGKSPVNYITRAQSRQLATNRGSNWYQLDFYTMSGLQVLALIEYGTFYLQSALAPGLTGVSDWTTYNDANPITITGKSLTNYSVNSGGASGTCLANINSYMSYRGIEHLYGHIWKWVDGFNINSNVPYVKTLGTFTDDTATNYTNIGGVTLANANGYVATLHNVFCGFLPATVGASGTTKVTDYYYQASGWRASCVGGIASSGASAGAWVWVLDSGSGGRGRVIGARLIL